ncbi:DUF6476 family protein [Tritonibacter mobilis]|uniref:DUF6476 family protein n=1 Tax=Tritonibacter mobilis TaxID=379347 RepID=UPI000806DD5E|nr:DUF6476 family protein [Tritonibacter mobilis]MBU3036403.1 hypothetical protein [Tritonibacter mobilis]WHQ83152.1 DUF6476 family protein [Tritonibacter mobilis]
MTHPSEPENITEPAQLRFLRRLVTTLTVIMVGGVLVVIALLVIRLSDDTAAPQLPAEITLPDGATARAVTFGTGWLAVVTTDDQILILDSETGALRQSVQID